MRKYLAIGSLALAGVALATFAPANAFVPVQTEIATAASDMGNTIEVKRRKSARPAGWSRGRKVGWRGGHRPPGQRR